MLTMGRGFGNIIERLKEGQEPGRRKEADLQGLSEEFGKEVF